MIGTQEGCRVQGSLMGGTHSKRLTSGTQGVRDNLHEDSDIVAEYVRDGKRKHGCALVGMCRRMADLM